MFDWFKNILTKESKTEKYQCCPKHTLTRQRIEDIKFPIYGVMGHPENTGRTQTHNYEQYQYWCECGEQLTDGPSGGFSVNAVCKKCRINYGCLPGYWGE